MPSLVKYENMERSELCIGKNNKYSNIILIDRKDDEKNYYFRWNCYKSRNWSKEMEVMSKHLRIFNFYLPQVDLGKYPLVLKQPSLPPDKEKV